MDPLEKARASALLLLKFRPRSEAELTARLARKGFDRSAIERVIAQLKRSGLLDDAKFARYLATQQMLNRPVGKRALADSLRAKGIDPATAASAIAQATEGVDELKTARQLAQERLSKMPGLSSDVLRRRLFGFLSRRGFSSEVVYRVVREAASRACPP